MYLVADAESREYALKVMNASTPDTVKEIERELKLLKMLKHPNIMPSLGYGKQHQEFGYLTVTYLLDLGLINIYFLLLSILKEVFGMRLNVSIMIPFVYGPLRRLVVFVSSFRHVKL